MGLVDSGALGFAVSGTVFSFGEAPEVGDFDVLGINSDTVVSTPSGFTVLQSNVANQGSYLFARQALGGESDSVTITTSGNHNASLVWARVRGAVAVDVSAKATTAGSSSGTSPTANSGTLGNTGELALSFVGVHRFAGSAPANPVWSNGFIGLELVTQGTGTTACAAFLGYKEDVGTASESVSVSWDNGAFDRDTYIVVFEMDEAIPQTVSPNGIPSGEAFGTVSLKFNQTVSLTGIPSGEAFGIAYINDGSRTPLDIQGELNRIAGTSGLGWNECANIIAGTTGLAMVGALNTYVGNEEPHWYDFQHVANQMAGTEGLGIAEALSLVEPV